MASCLSWEVCLSDIQEENCAQSRDRTGTILLSLVFETSASTNSAIWAIDNITIRTSLPYTKA
jgi:hypothetical protein